MKMRIAAVTAIAAILLATASTSAQMSNSVSFVNNLMPQPASLTAGNGSFALTGAFTAAPTGFDNERLDDAITRSLLQLRQRTGLPIVPAKADAGKTAQLTIDVKSAGETVQSVDEVESYTLTVTASGVQITAPTVVGAMHGLATLVQLVQPAGNSFVLPIVSIQDSPRFPWRGLMIDCGRHFEPISVIKRSIDAMAAVKLNVFHWHLTEDQGFRMQSKLYPKLTSKGSDNLFYTQDEARDIVSYARARGIRVVPEFEMPGHSTAWQYAYPELASGKPPAGIRREFGVSPYAMDPTRDATYTFIARFLGEMTTIFPDPYYHIGGDETPAPDWKTNPRIRAFMRAHDLKDNAALQAYFNTRVLKILQGLHKHMVGWDEILNPALPRDVVIQSWRGEKSLAEGATQGFQGILSAGYYLDGMQSAGKHYLVDPVPADTTLTPAQQKLILGGETPMWGEQVYERTIDSRIWPRAAAIAERYWSPQNVTNVDDMYRRLDAVSIQLEALGLHHLDQEGAGLRELLGSDNSAELATLKTFAGAFEPVSFGERYHQQRTNQLTVLNRFVDAVRPDPPARHMIEVETRNFLAAPQTDTADRDALTTWFTTVAATVPPVEVLIKRSPIMNEMNSLSASPFTGTAEEAQAIAAAAKKNAPPADQHAPQLSELHTRARQLSGLSQTALDAINYLSTGKKAPAGWKQAKLAQIAAAKKPSAIVRFIFIDQLALMVNAVQE